jgi:hypothetical protein
MLEFISQVGVGAFIALIAIVGGLLVPLTAIIGAFTYKHRRLHLEAALKQQMIERGMSAEEIREVLQASMSRKTGHRCSDRQPGRESSDIRA